MSDPFVAEIRMFGGNFAPTGWAFCNGALLSIAQNSALFSLLGTTYGGNGKNNFALPDLQGRAPMMWGTGPGLTPRDIGETGGTIVETLQESQMATHQHIIYGTAERGDTNQAANQQPGEIAGSLVYTPLSSDGQVPMNPSILGEIGGGQPHNNRQPYLAVSFIIALKGLFPQHP